MGKKVLVKSIHREAVVRTTRTLSRDKDGKIVESEPGFRQFTKHQCYMTPEEAAEVVESHENLLHIDAGVPAPYYYPMGVPVPVDEDYEGPLSPPLSGAGLIAGNAQQAEAAKRVGAAADRQIAQRLREMGELEKSGARPKAIETETPPDSEQAASSGSKPTRITNPDARGNEDLLSDIPTFRDSKAAAANANP